jgi:hypothetical protein
MEEHQCRLALVRAGDDLVFEAMSLDSDEQYIYYNAYEAGR